MPAALGRALPSRVGVRPVVATLVPVVLGSALAVPLVATPALPVALGVTVAVVAEAVVLPVVALVALVSFFFSRGPPL